MKPSDVSVYCSVSGSLRLRRNSSTLSELLPPSLNESLPSFELSRRSTGFSWIGSSEPGAAVFIVSFRLPVGAAATPLTLACGELAIGGNLLCLVKSEELERLLRLEDGDPFML